MTAPTMLGLQRGIVRVVPYQPGWLSIFAECAAAIRARTGLPDTHVQHVGSTSVPGLPSKPILDIVIGFTADESADGIAAQLVDLGYVDRGSHEGSVGRLLVMESAPNVRTVHVHVVRFQSADWLDYVIFRDALRSDDGLRDRYAAFKTRLAETFSSDRTAYTNAKESFIRAVFSDARAARTRGT